MGSETASGVRVSRECSVGVRLTRLSFQIIGETQKKTWKIDLSSFTLLSHYPPVASYPPANWGACIPRGASCRGFPDSKGCCL